MPASLLERALSDGDALPADEVSSRVLDAALVELSEFGIRRASIDAVVRRSGVSRMTVWRRFPGKDALVEAVLRREVQRFFAELSGSIPSEGSPAERVAATFAVGTRRVINHPVFGRLLDTDPEAVLPFVTTGGGALVEFAIANVERAIAASEPGLIEGQRIRQAAEVIVRLGHSIVLSTRPADCPSGRELRALGVVVLSPLLTLGAKERSR